MNGHPPASPASVKRTPPLAIPTPWDAAARAGIQRALLDWFHERKRDLPWRRSRDPYAILVSEIMLQQTTVKAVIPYFTRWMARFPTWHALACANESEVLKFWEGLGYYRRARNLYQAARDVVERHAGNLPASPDAIRALPGVGPYTAGAVASIAFNLPEPAVDGNIERVLARLGNLSQRVDQPPGRRTVWAWARVLVDPHNPGDFNQALMELGATLCTPHQPCCLMCPLRQPCQARAPEHLPFKAARPAVTRTAEDVAIVARADRRLLLVQVPEGGRWAGLWRFPHFPDSASTADAPLAEFDYAVTRFRIHLRAFARPAPPPLPPGWNFRWVAPADFRSLPMPAPHRRLAEALESPTLSDIVWPPGTSHECPPPVRH